MSARTDENSPYRTVNVGPDSAVHTALEWVDVDRRNWRIELTAERMILRSGDEIVDLPAGSWTNDILVSQHGDGFIIRVETFERMLRFIVPHDQAKLFLARPGMPSTAQTPRVTTLETSTHDAPLLWPKVSPLAVWALMCSALVFIPVLGLLPAVATVALLVLHRSKVRRARAYQHSRTLCRAAFVLMIMGLIVSALATWGLARHAAMSGMEQVIAGHAASGRNWGVIAGGILVVLLSLSMHEAAHAITAWWLGDGLARSLGRVTLNPLAHIDPFGTVLLPLILVMAGGPVFGYARPVPVRVESLPRHRRAHILISLAGPGSNLLLGAVSLMVLLALGCVVRMTVPQAVVTGFSAFSFSAPIQASGFALAPVFGAFCTILKLSFIINIVLAIFNLIPIPPLDGSWVLEHLFPRSLGRLYARVRPYGFLIFLGAIYMGLFDYLVVPVVAVLVPGLLLLATATGF